MLILAIYLVIRDKIKMLNSTGYVLIEIVSGSFFFLSTRCVLDMFWKRLGFELQRKLFWCRWVHRALWPQLTPTTQVYKEPGRDDMRPGWPVSRSGERAIPGWKNGKWWLPTEKAAVIPQVNLDLVQNYQKLSMRPKTHNDVGYVNTMNTVWIKYCMNHNPSRYAS